MESNFTESNELQALTLSEGMKSNIQAGAKWAKFLGIMGFIGSGGMALLAIVMLFGGLFAKIRLNAAINPGIIAFLYLVFGAINFLPALYMFNFGKFSKVGIESVSQKSLEDGISNLKSFFRFLGIYVIVLLSIYALLIISVVAIGIANAV